MSLVTRARTLYDAYLQVTSIRIIKDLPYHLEQMQKFGTIFHDLSLDTINANTNNKRIRRFADNVFSSVTVVTRAKTEIDFASDRFVVNLYI